MTRGWLGVSIQQLTPELAQSFGVSEARGALVADVTSSGPAEKSGMKRGDVIVSYDGKKIEESAALPTLVAATPVGKTVPVEVIRKGKSKTLAVTVSRLVEQTAADDPTPQ